MPARSRSRAQSGAVLVLVAVALVGLTAFSMLAIDYGVLWASRAQAQTAADAGALAGAVSLAFVDPDDQTRARNDASVTARRNLVWGTAPVVDPARDVQIIPCPPGSPVLPDTCVRVDAYRGAPDRTGTRQGTVLPTFFGRLVGVNQQAVRATATAQVLVGSRVTCLKPWAIPDRWKELLAPGEEYNRYVTRGNNRGTLNPEPRDVYIPPPGSEAEAPTNLTPGEAAWGPSGYDPVNRPEQIGMQVVLKAGLPNDALQPGWFFPIDLPLPGGPETGGDRYRENIAHCNSMPVAIGDVLVTEPGNMIGPTQQGVRDLIAQDPSASWDASLGRVVNSCCAASPRWVPIPVFSPEAYATEEVDPTNGRFNFRVVNILGFFIEGMDGNDVVGRLTLFPGMYNAGSGEATPTASFLRTVMLVR